MYHDLQHGSCVTQKGLSTIENEIGLEKTHFDFSSEGHFLKAMTALRRAVEMATCASKPGGLEILLHASAADYKFLA